MDLFTDDLLGLNKPKSRVAALRGDPVEDYGARGQAMFDQGMALLNQPVDPRPFQEQAARNKAGSKNALVLALAAQQAGQGFEPIGAHYLKQASAKAGPVKVGNEGYIDEETGAFVQDPTADRQRRAQLLLTQAQKYEALAARAIDAREKAAAAAEARRLQQEFQRSMQQDRLAMQASLAADRNAAAATAREDRVNDRRRTEAERQTERLSRDLDKGGLPELDTSVRALEAAMTKFEGRNLPGFGEVAGALPDWMVSGEGKELRQTYAAVRNAILKARSGGAVTDGEARRLLQELGEGFGRGDDLARQGVINVRNILNEKLLNVRGGYTPEAIGMYEERGGLNLSGVQRQALPAGVTPQPIQQGAVRPAAPAAGDVPPPGAVRPKGGR